MFHIMDKKIIYLAPETDWYDLQGPTAILAGSGEAGTSPFENEEEEYTL